MHKQLLDEYSSDDLLIKKWSHSSLINFFLVKNDLIHRWLIFSWLTYDTSNFEKKKFQSWKLNGDVDTGCNYFCCLYLIFTAPWKKIVISIALVVPAILIPFVVHWYCRFYKKQDNAVTAQQVSVHPKGPSEHHRSDEELTLEAAAFLPFTVANLRFQPSC